MYVFVDTETTGLVKPEGTKLELQPRMTEIAAIVLDEDLEITQEYNQLINPGIPLPEIITKITGITDAMLKDQPTFGEIFADIVPMFHGKKYLVAHNASFDQSIIYFDVLRAGKQFNFPWPPETYCTVEQSLFIKGYRLKLGEIYKLATGKEIKGAHRAINDTRATVEVFRWLKQKEKELKGKVRRKLKKK